MSSIVSEAHFQAQYQQQLASNEKNDIPSKVLLVCVYNISGRIITHDIFYRLFSDYGEVLKILIFEKAKVWKSFVEMRTLEEALYAKQKLNNYILFNDGSQIKIFYAHIQQIKFCRNLSDGVDYEQLQMLKKALTKKNNSQQIISEQSSSSFDKNSLLDMVDLNLPGTHSIPENLSSLMNINNTPLESAKAIINGISNSTESPLYQKSSSTFSAHSTTTSIQSMISKMSNNFQQLQLKQQSQQQQTILKEDGIKISTQDNTSTTKNKYFLKDDLKESYESSKKLEVDYCDEKDDDDEDSLYQENDQDYADYESHKHIYDHIHTIIADEEDSDSNSNDVANIPTKLPQKLASSQVLLNKEYPSSSDEIQILQNNINQKNQLQHQSQSYTATSALNSMSFQHYSQTFLCQNQKKLNYSNNFKRNSDILISLNAKQQLQDQKQNQKQSKQLQNCPQKMRMSLDLSLKKLDQILDNISEKDYYDKEEKNIIQALEDKGEEEEDDVECKDEQNNDVDVSFVEDEVKELLKDDNDDNNKIVGVVEEITEQAKKDENQTTVVEENCLSAIKEEKEDRLQLENLITEMSKKTSISVQQPFYIQQQQQQMSSQQAIELDKLTTLIDSQQIQNMQTIETQPIMTSQQVVQQKQQTSQEISYAPFPQFLSQPIINPQLIQQQQQQQQQQLQQHFQPQLQTQSQPFQPQNFLLNQQQQQQQILTQQQQQPQSQMPSQFQQGQQAKPVDDSIQQLADIYQTYDAEEINPAYYVNPKFLLENKKSQTLYIRGLDINKVTAQQLFNLFSNFGNVKSIMFLKKNNIILMEFQNINFATQAKDFLNNAFFLGGQMKIFYSNYESLTQKQLNQNSKFTKETFFESDIKQHRFKEDEVLNTQLINPPSQILYISNLAPQVCNMEFITKLFSPYGNIQNIKFQNTNSKKNKCFVKFGNLQESFNAMANLHSTYFYGRKTYISFTRAKI